MTTHLTELGAATRCDPLEPGVPAIWLKRPEPRTTIVFDSYWEFATERQAIFYRRLQGARPPWTDDPILQAFKFTNAFRASDRTSQYLIRHVIYAGDQTPREVFLRTLLFKLFNRIETWQGLAPLVGSVSSNSFDAATFGRAIDALRSARQQVYSAAYIMPPVGVFAAAAKHDGHLALLAMMLRDALPERIADASSLRAVYEALLGYPSLGRFLAFQFAIDLNYGPAIDFDEGTFVVAGPGAKEGISKCFAERDGWSDEDLIHWTVDRQEREFGVRGLPFRSLFGRPLQPIDCQNLYCEIAKYARVAHPSYTQPGGRARIKQRFAARGGLPSVWYPPKWGLNAAASIGDDGEVAPRQVELNASASSAPDLAPNTHAREDRPLPLGW